MRAFAVQPLARSLRAIVSSNERKAVESAAFLAEITGLAPLSFADLGENDRSSTGYMPRAEFEAMADRFFANPDESVRGWESARDAQARIVGAVKRVLAIEGLKSPVAIVAHGGVGALLLCALLRAPITRSKDQPGSEGGNYFCFDGASWTLEHEWRSIDSNVR
jgi:broad specificity phosphatase PhoE